MRRSLIFASTVALMHLQAHADVKNQSLVVTNAHIFAPIKGSNVTAGYVIFTNPTDKEITISIEKAAAFKAVELHKTTERQGRMAMHKVDQLTIPAKGSLELKPGGHHIMLFDPRRELKKQEHVTVTFKVDGKIQEMKFRVELRVAPTH